MRAVMVMFDSLNRRFLEPYGCDFSETPNFRRLAEKTVCFDRFYVGSLPCMPARRDLQTGRYSFLHRSWGPMEPFDNSMPQMLKEHGIFTRLVSDHGHYWETGGCTYHTMYSSWECHRGQEADPWSGRSDSPEIPEHVPVMREFTHPEWWRNNWCNRERYRREGRWPSDRVFDDGLEFLAENAGRDNWFLQIETFSPHEPFDVPEECDPDYAGPHFDWPSYAPVTESREQVAHIRRRYGAVLRNCDRNLGRVLDFMDEHDMWKDTMLIVNTDHGFMLGEKDWWAKSVMPCYNELANIPFFLWNPKIPVCGERRQALCQTIDIPVTLLDFFGVPAAPEMQGKSLEGVLRFDEAVREYAVFGFHGSFVNITDGKNLYMRAAATVSNTPLNEYTLMPAHQETLFAPKELAQAEMCGPLSFTKGARVMRIPVESRLANATFCNSFQYGSFLFDLESDPEQINPLDDPEKEARMAEALICMMKQSDAPEEQYERLGLNRRVRYDGAAILKEREGRPGFSSFPVTAKYQWEEDARQIFIGMLSLVGEKRVEEYLEAFDQVMRQTGDRTVTRKHFEILARRFYSDNEGKVFYFINKLARLR
ncbi:MAG: sulfatase-like hydrolase/transferase [Lachnospiraceae bacterium]|jgi:arylsulfatase A-like enzyme|nr:sulfatase-like hydrolase/transferase [Lachnospiraceae bacterium]